MSHTKVSPVVPNLQESGHKADAAVFGAASGKRMMQESSKVAKYNLGQVVRHREHPFRGVVFDVDPEFANTEEWYESIPEDSRPARNQPFYHLYAETEATYYVAYVSEQNLVPDVSGEPLEHPEVAEMFGEFVDGRYPLPFSLN